MNRLFKKLSFLLVGVTALTLVTSCSSSPSNKKVENENILWSFKTGGKVLSSPIEYKDSIIFGSKDNLLYSVDKNSHEKTWSFEGDSPMISTPILDSSNIIYNSQNSIYSINGDTGTKNWSFSSTEAVTPEIDGYDYHTTSPSIFNDVVVYPSGSGRIYGLNKTDGTKLWDIKPDGIGEIRASSLVENILVFADVAGNCYALDVQNQKVLWKESIGSKMVHIASAYKGFAYFGGRDCNLVAFDIKSGEKIWSYGDSQGSWLTGQLEFSGDSLYLPGSDNHKMLAIKYDTGVVLNSYSSNANIFSKATVKENVLYFTDGDVYSLNSGALYGYDLNSGEKVLYVKMPRPSFSTPLVTDSAIYFGSNDSNLYAVKPITK